MTTAMIGAALTDNDERKRFWDTLMEAHDGSGKTINQIASAIPGYERLCRFRTVNESSLLQLQSNKLFFASADYYDDPFDTYFYIDYEKVRWVANKVRDSFESGGVDALRALVSEINMNPIATSAVEYILEHPSQEMPEASYFENELQSIRLDLLKCCYSICFCDDPLNENLWLKYANAHRGFVQIYDTKDPNVIRCGTTGSCSVCMFNTRRPAIYPVYYSDERYDATRYVLAERALSSITNEMRQAVPAIESLITGNVVWEIERIALIKKRCHQYDGEWRMICPTRPKERPGIGMKPTSVALGLRMPEYERRLVISAAKVARIENVYEMYIDATDCLNMRKIDYCLD